MATDSSRAVPQCRVCVASRKKFFFLALYIVACRIIHTYIRDKFFFSFISISLSHACSEPWRVCKWLRTSHLISFFLLSLYYTPCVIRYSGCLLSLSFPRFSHMRPKSAHTNVARVYIVIALGVNRIKAKIYERERVQERKRA